MFLLYININSAWLAAICIMFTLLFIQAAHSIISGTMSMDLGGRKATGTATGLIDGAQYLMGSVAGYGMGRALDMYKSTGHEFFIWPLIPIPMALIGMLCACSIWSLKTKHEH
jgi:sugar phosphate permease